MEKKTVGIFCKSYKQLGNTEKADIYHQQLLDLIDE